MPKQTKGKRPASAGKQPASSRVRICYHPDALAELPQLTVETRRNVISEVGGLDGRPYQDIVAILDKRTEKKVYQREKSDARGTLRIIFAWGAASGVLWVIGAYVKHNDPEGERLFRRIAHRVREVATMSPC